MRNNKLAVVGLGYVGLPIAYAFSQAGFEVIGYDNDPKKIELLKKGVDPTKELPEGWQQNAYIQFTDNPFFLSIVSYIIVCVPTPIDAFKQPDLSLLKKASQTISLYFPQNAVIVYESTVYPGCTREFCKPILDQGKGNYILGYSPERINPGDKQHTLKNTTKIVSALTYEDSLIVRELYAHICPNIYVAGSIEIAEGAKIIENTQRDINIAFMNEMQMLFDKMQIDFSQVLKAAQTKWNFLPFKPGLVGGHCISVDPYYLAAIAKRNDFDTKMILAGRQINDSMPKYLLGLFMEKFIKLGLRPHETKVALFGLTFKENVPDFRNSKALEFGTLLERLGFNVHEYDPYLDQKKYDGRHFHFAFILVEHDEFFQLKKINADHIFDLFRPRS